MKRSTKKNEDPEFNSFEKFLMELCTSVNEGVHKALSASEDFLDNHELKDYIEDDGLNLRAIEENEDLTVEQVVMIGVNFANYSIHANWHEVMEVVAKKAGIENFELPHKERKSPGIKVVTDVNELPDEVVDALKDLLNKKGKK
jgi:hypothetical protein